MYPVLNVFHSDRAEPQYGALDNEPSGKPGRLWPAPAKLRERGGKEGDCVCA